MADGYLRRLRQDLDRWIEAGLIAAENRDAILSSVSPGRSRWSASGAAAILGAALMGLAVISFFAANWSDLSVMTRFGVVLGALSISYCGAVIAFARGNPAIGHGLALLGAALFGGAIILTAQTFNLSAFRNTGILIWALGALATALVIPSRPVMILAAGLGGAWLVSELTNPVVTHVIWSFPVLALALSASSAWLRSTASQILVTLGLLIWIWDGLDKAGEVLGFSANGSSVAFVLISAALAFGAAVLRDRNIQGFGAVVGICTAAAALGVFAAQGQIESYDETLPGPGWFALTGFSLAAAMALAWVRVQAKQLAPALALGLAAAGLGLIGLVGLSGLDALPEPIIQMVGGAFVFSIAATLVLVGAAPGRAAIGAIGVVLFIAQSIYVYVELFGGLLQTSAFFLIGGLLLLALSLGLTRLSARLRARQEAGDTDSGAMS